MASVMLDTPSVIVSRMEVPFPSVSLSMLFTSLPLSPGERHIESGQRSMGAAQKAVQASELRRHLERLHPPPGYLAKSNLEDRPW
jgi:hypothetical protein